MGVSGIFHGSLGSPFTKSLLPAGEMLDFSQLNACKMNVKIEIRFCKGIKHSGKRETATGYKYSYNGFINILFQVFHCEDCLIKE